MHLSFYHIKAGEYHGVFPKLIERIASVQKNRGIDLSNLIEDFSPILKKYATRLNYEDALADLQLDFIKLISNFKTDCFYPQEDQYVLAYIEKTIKNAYIRRSKEKTLYKDRCDLFEDLSNTQKLLIEQSSATYDRYSEFDIAHLKQLLPSCQFKVIYLLYYLDLSVSEAGQALGISRQAVNQTKCKALAKLREAWL